MRKTKCCPFSLLQILGLNRCLLLLFATSVVIAGCAGKRIDLFETLDSVETAEKSAEAGEDDPALIAKAEDKSRLAILSSFYRKDEQQDDPRETKPSLSDRLRSIVTRDHNQELATTDPFIQGEPVQTRQTIEKTSLEATSKQKEEATSDQPTVEELLASFQRESNKKLDTNPWWQEAKPDSDLDPSRPAAKDKTSVADANEFDSRLDQLRAELASVEPRTTSTYDRFIPTAPTVEPMETVDSSIETSDEVDWSFVNSTEDSTELGPTTEQPQITRPETSLELESPKIRIQSMLADARRDWEESNLRQAYRTALDAQELAVMENVSFSADEEHPQALANQIAADLQQMARPETELMLSIATPSDHMNPFAVEAPQAPADPFESLASSFDFPKFGAEDRPQSESPSLSDSKLSMACAAEEPSIIESGGSGVSLLPPNDDFPSEAEGIIGNNRTAQTLNLNEKIQLTMHRTPEFTLQRYEKSMDQHPGMTDEGNQNLLSTIAKQRSRVLESKSVKWPSQPSPDGNLLEKTVNRGPIRVAEAPKYTPNDSMSIATEKAAEENLTTQAESGSILGQIWRSQPVWFIGGLVLLVIALRLLPWPKPE